MIASAEAVELVGERGGRLFVWRARGKCCGGVAFLRTSTDPPRRLEFEEVEGAPFRLFVARLGAGPEELHVEARGRRRRRVEAYWDGCAFVV